MKNKVKETKKTVIDFIVNLIYIFEKPNYAIASFKANLLIENPSPQNKSRRPEWRRLFPNNDFMSLKIMIYYFELDNYLLLTNLVVINKTKYVKIGLC